MSGTLFVVATPIGNLEDITLRALRVLREADVIAAEDTRRTAKLLAHYTISTPTLSFHEHNSRARLPQIVGRLERGQRVALVTDAGTPGISDPGIDLVRACAEKGIPIDPIPGPSAPMAAAIASGFSLDPLTIFGFAPARAKERRSWLLETATVAGAFTFFETPHRILQTLKELESILGERPILVAREMTKVHQEFLKGSAATILGRLTDPRGEFTVVVGPLDQRQALNSGAEDQDIYAEFGRIAESGEGGRRALIAALAKKHGRSSKNIYDLIERIKTSGV